MRHTQYLYWIQTQLVISLTSIMQQMLLSVPTRIHTVFLRSFQKIGTVLSQYTHMHMHTHIHTYTHTLQASICTRITHHKHSQTCTDQIDKTSHLCKYYTILHTSLHIQCLDTIRSILIFFVSCIYSDLSELRIEEDTQYVELEIRRSYGTFGHITVTLNTIQESAISPSG